MTVDSDDAQGVLLGIACGDALGRPVEGGGPEAIEEKYGKLTDMVGDGVFRAEAGRTTDDTALALRLARSLDAHNRFNPADVADRFQEGYETSGFGVGQSTKKALNQLDRYGWARAGLAIWEDSPEGRNAGNGSVMRCPPLALAYTAPDASESTTPDLDLDTASRLSSIITHPDPRCTYGCIILNRTIQGLLRNNETPLQTALQTVRPQAPSELVTRLSSVRESDAVAAAGLTPYVVDTLQIALYYGLTADSSATAIVNAVNHGGDTDTTAAIAGAVAGAAHGASTLPDEWLSTVDHIDELQQLADRLAAASMDPMRQSISDPIDTGRHFCEQCGRSLPRYGRLHRCPNCDHTFDFDLD